MPLTPPPAVPALDPEVSLAETDDGAVLLHQRTGRYWQLNRTGVQVLRRLTEGWPAERIAAELAARHRIDTDAAHRDVTRLIEGLASARLLRKPS
ncbi:lasso peptide biosynthesis PqqD family chaperone [Streptomyces sp. XD-27]|uniref:lasso peptide biosynthesis PqqD family chaperone n=1 Tax=Streptomyces sp. XD-27 TaxID=3062779 RepID=UPI0026F43227|nr:lasso peptide biosynthesis PqqD family chaperone [Streptomyces sp. XD-27]WKX70384.1 lasso peptide biosynthesis PqqD family chaperone [Streptomyces sp. XD-27]